jgi:cation diffusion facilitator CzcD-associated flavoprotein CzcO
MKLAGHGACSSIQVRLKSFTLGRANHAIGVRSDSDLFTYGFPWRPWKEKRAIASGANISRYLKESAAQEGIDRKIKFNHRLKRVQWSSSDKIWTLQVTTGAAQRTLRTRFLLFGTGYYDYDEALKVNIPGIQNFRGPVVHPQFWPSELDYADKRVVVIGSGATAITLLPAMANSAAHVTMLQRSASYIISLPSEDKTETAIRFMLPERLALQLIRFKWMLTSFILVTFCQWFPKIARRLHNSATQAQLPPGMDLNPNFNPRYNLWEQRLCICPDGDFYSSLRSGRASVKTGVIDTVTPTSIRLKSGEELVPDIIVTATGLKLRIGGGVEIIVDGQMFQISDHFMWNGAFLEGLPNFLFAFGYVDASWTMGADATAQLACRLLAQMKKKNVKMVVPRQSREEKARIKDVPFFRLSSTYIEKGKADLPKVGDRGPWQRRSYYWRDILTAWYGSLRTGLEWSN